MYHGEKFNAWTHLAGALLALASALWLLKVAIGSGDGWRIFSVAVYGATLVLLYSISTIYSTASPPSITACAGGPRRSCASSTTCRSTC